MRTAAEIMAANFVYGRGQEEAIIKVINEARKEAIEAAAEKVKQYSGLFDYSGDKANGEVSDEILSLINELK